METTALPFALLSSIWGGSRAGMDSLVGYGAASSDSDDEAVRQRYRRTNTFYCRPNISIPPLLLRASERSSTAPRAPFGLAFALLRPRLNYVRCDQVPAQAPALSSSTAIVMAPEVDVTTETVSSCRERRYLGLPRALPRRAPRRQRSARVDPSFPGIPGVHRPEQKGAEGQSDIRGDEPANDGARESAPARQAEQAANEPAERQPRDGRHQPL